MNPSHRRSSDSVPAWMAVVVLGLAACSREAPTPVARDTSQVAKAPASASSSASLLPAPSASQGETRFVRQRPTEREGVDACAYLGGFGFACLDALMAEKDPAKRRYMRRLSDAAATIELEAHRKGEFGGVAHAELAMNCAEKGPCKQKGRDGAVLDDGYACLTAAEGALNQKQAAASKKAHARACLCDPERAQIPVMGGVLACDGLNLPVERGKDLSLAEAQEVLSCATCDPEAGPRACAAEVARLRAKDPEVGSYLEATHVPRCRKP